MHEIPRTDARENIPQENLDYEHNLSNTYEYKRYLNLLY